jgi:acyl-CoA reductase-like NAD-dependent aldehyde dehydrogenase
VNCQSGVDQVQNTIPIMIAPMQPYWSIEILSLRISAANALVEHPDVDLIAFTGSNAVGRKIAAAAGAQLKKVNLELGSIDPFIVFKDADLDVAVLGVAWARLLNAGQVKAGTFWINDPLTDNDAAPFGGMRHSGIGRELGAEGLDAFREPKHVHLDWVMERKPWFFPYRDRKP